MKEPTPRCSRCGGVHANDDDVFWDDGKGGVLCQMCWEAVADREWWERMKAIESIQELMEKGNQ